MAKGFKVELLHSVPKGEQGSWVNMCTDPKGRLIVSDQYGGLFRVTPPPIGSKGKIKIEKINVDIGEAQGLLWAFDSLYVVVNRGRKYQSGLYRVTDTDGDDQLDKLEILRKLDGGGEHGPHAVLLTPDKKALYIVCGNGTKMTEFTHSRVPRVWDEDLLLPRTYGRGFMKGKPAPGGYISRVDKDGKNWELVATGFRNEFDAALNEDGELFTYDADMEWDVNTPWYRPTRINHVVSGADFGWRNGAGKWPAYYPESLPSVVDVGPGSPTGICFGHDAKFPEKYRRALFICDWSYGKMYAVHMKPKGASYTGTLEEFVTGTPLPLTDVITNPHDGALYFAIGGRRVQSGLYRVTYVGGAPKISNVTDNPPEPSVPSTVDSSLGGQRRSLERLHAAKSPNAIEDVWPNLGQSDRFLRGAARVAIEHQPVDQWKKRALQEADTQTSLTALLALVRQYPRVNRKPGQDVAAPSWTDHDNKPTVERLSLLNEVLGSLEQHDWNSLSVAQKVELLRVQALAFIRLGRPTMKTRKRLIAKFDRLTPDKAREVNSELVQLLVYLQASSAAAKGVELLREAPTQEEQIDYAKNLRHLQEGWTDELQREYFQWFVKASGYRGGASFRLFVQHIKEDAVKRLSDKQKASLKEVLTAKATQQVNPISLKTRPFVKKWTMKGLVPLVTTGLRGRDFDRGRKMFAATNCFACHRFDNQGGAVGPDLTSLAGRFSARDILESVLEPSKTISDQYQAVTIRTDDGKVVTGRIVNLAGDTFRISTNMLDPGSITVVDRRRIDAMMPSKLSMMPEGLLDTLNKDELLDLMAYLLSRGDRSNAMFAKKKP